MLRLVTIAIVALTLSGCAALDPGGRSVLSGGSSFIAKTENPVSRNDMAAIQLSYNTVVVGLNAYYSLPICAPRTSATWTNVCSEPAVRQRMARYRRAARAAILEVREFRKQYPTLSAADLIRRAGELVQAFKTEAIVSGVKVQ